MTQLEPDRVYLYRLPVEGDVVPFERYRNLARQAVGRLDLALPEAGTIAVKPNITIPAEPDSRIITHPGFVLGLLEVFVARGVAPERLVVMEGWGRPQHRRQDRDHRRRAAALPEVSGYDRALAALGLRLTNHDEVEGMDVDVPGGRVFTRLRITDHAVTAGLLVNVPVAKCHNLACTTLCTKNLQGLVMSPQRHMCSVQAEDEGLARAELSRLDGSGCSLHEERFANKHADLLAAFRRTGVPRLCVVDGMVGRDGTAFNEGDNHGLGWTLIGDNEVHVDAVGSYLFGLDPEQIPHLRVAAGRGLGTHRVADIEVVDLASGRSLDRQALDAHRAAPALMPLARGGGGYYARFRRDGTLVPWMLDRVNEQRHADGLEPILAA